MWRLRVQMGHGVGIGHGAARTRSPSARGHPTHHRTRLAHLGSSWCGNTRVHLLYHARAGVTSIWVLTGHWVVTRGQAVLWDALMGSEWLRHHHCGRFHHGRGSCRAKYRDGDEKATGICI